MIPSYTVVEIPPLLRFSKVECLLATVLLIFLGDLTKFWTNRGDTVKLLTAH